MQAQFRIELSKLHAPQLQCNLMRTCAYTFEKEIPGHLCFGDRCNEELRRRMLSECC